jgi:hypothetical protein
MMPHGAPRATHVHASEASGPLGAASVAATARAAAASASAPAVCWSASSRSERAPWTSPFMRRAIPRAVSRRGAATLGFATCSV